MRSVLRLSAQGTAVTRVVCLPGAYHAPEHFLAAGFDAEVRKRGLHIDLAFVDFETTHVGDRSFLCAGASPDGRSDAAC